MRGVTNRIVDAMLTDMNTDADPLNCETGYTDSGDRRVLLVMLARTSEGYPRGVVPIEAWGVLAAELEATLSSFVDDITSWVDRGVLEWVPCKWDDYGTIDPRRSFGFKIKGRATSW